MIKMRLSKLSESSDKCKTRWQSAELHERFWCVGLPTSKNDKSNAPHRGFCVKGWMERFQWPAPPDRHRHTARPSFRLCCCCKTEHREASRRPTLPPVSLGRLGKQTAPCPKPHSTWDQSAACSVLAEGHADKFPLTHTALPGENSCRDNTGWKKKTNINWLPHGSKLSLGSLGMKSEWPNSYWEGGVV